jgi:hypothetical protein
VQRALGAVPRFPEGGEEEESLDHKFLPSSSSSSSFSSCSPPPHINTTSPHLTPSCLWPGEAHVQGKQKRKQKDPGHVGCLERRCNLAHRLDALRVGVGGEDEEAPRVVAVGHRLEREAGHPGGVGAEEVGAGFGREADRAA